MNDPLLPAMNIAALGQADEWEGGGAGDHGDSEGCLPTHHQHATASTTTSTCTSTTTSTTTTPTACSAAAATKSTTTTTPTGTSSPGSLRKRRSAAAMALINRGWTRLGTAVAAGGGPSSCRGSPRSSKSVFHRGQDASSPEELFQIKFNLLMKNPAIMARFQDRLRTDSPQHGHDEVVRLVMQDFFVNQLVLVDLGPEILQQATIRRLGSDSSGDCVETRELASSSSRPSLFRRFRNSGGEETTTDFSISSSSSLQQKQQSSTTVPRSPNKNEVIADDSSFASPQETQGAQSPARRVVSTDTSRQRTSPTPLNSNANIENKRPAFLNLPAMEETKSHNVRTPSTSTTTTFSESSGSSDFDSSPSSLDEEQDHCSLSAGTLPEAVDSSESSSSGDSKADNDSLDISNDSPLGTMVDEQSGQILYEL